LLPRSKAPLLLITVAIAIEVIALLLPPIPQPRAYHNFADQGSWLGIPNFEGGVSNAPFAMVGLGGLIFMFRPRPAKFSDRREPFPYPVMFAGLILTAFGSTVIAGRVGVGAGLALFPVLQ
jgi:hypothetical protein